LKAYIDTSVLVACYCPEALSGKSEAAVKKLSDPAISLLVELEFASALALKARTGGLNRTDGQKVISLFLSHLNEGRLRVLPMEARHFMLAREWISRLDSPLRTLDALHLALAFANSMRILTADVGQFRVARDLGIDCRLVG